MATTVGSIMDELDAFQKQAQASLEGIDSMPGSENDKPIPAGATNPDPKVKDPTIDQPAERTLSGAKPGSDFPANNINETEAGQPALTPEKKPLDTADANAKTAAAGNSIVEFILKTKKENAEKTAAEAAAKEAAAKEAAAKEAAAKATASAAPDAQPAVPAEKKAAPAQTISLDMALMAKIAAITLADEEGQQAVQAAIAKRAGAEFANDIMDTLEKRAAEEQAAWEFEKGAQDAEAMIGDLQEAQGAEDAEAMLGGAGDAAAAEAGAASAEGDIPMSGEEAAAALPDYSADEIVQAVNDLAADGTIPADQAQEIIDSVAQAAGAEGSPEDISEEDVAEALIQAVESGNMTPEQAQAVAEGVSEGGGDPEADQALMNDVSSAGAEGGEAAAAAEAEKAAAIKEAAAKKEAAEKRAAFKAQLVAVLKKGKK